MVENLLSDVDSSDIFTEDATKSYYKSNFTRNAAAAYEGGRYERSEGEIGGPSSGDISSDVRFPSNPRSQHLSNRVAYNAAQNAAKQRSITPNQAAARPSRHHELGQTYDFEQNQAQIDENDVEKPVYDSSDGPVPKNGKAVQGRGKADVFVSGESFGGRGKFKAGAGRGGRNDRETIGETFLEDDDDSQLVQESGEIDPRLFK